MQTEILDTRRVSPADVDEMFALFDRFYVNTDFQRFRQDFAEKDWLIRMKDGARLVGFSTQKEITLSDGDTTQRFLFSGDTIVHPDYWNRSHLAGAFGHLFLRLEAEAASPLYWFLISKGYRTYRFLPVFFHHFHPRHQGNDTDMKTRLDSIASSVFGSHYDPDSGIIDFQGNRDHLQDILIKIPPGREKDPHVAFFLAANPGYVRGTELACLCPLSRENLTRCGTRVIASTQVSWHV